MDADRIAPGTVVVGVDGSQDSRRALDWGVEQAALEHRPLTLVHAVQPAGFPPAGTFVASGVDYGALLDVLLQSGREVLAEARAHALAHEPDLDVAEVLSSGDARNELVGLGRRAAMVVVGSRGRGPVSSLLLGSVSVGVSKAATCPVVVCRPTPADGGEPARDVVVGVDGTERSLPAAEFAFRVAALRGVSLTVLHSYWDARELGRDATSAELDVLRASVAASVSAAAEKYPDVDVGLKLRHGFADRNLVEASRDHALLVLAHQPLAAIDDLVYGSVAPAVVEHARCAVAVVPVSRS